MARCFVIQGFGKKTDYTDGRVLDLDASYAVIKEAVTACGVECIRADEILHSGTIDRPMYEQLLGADLVIAPPMGESGWMQPRRIPSFFTAGDEAHRQALPEVRRLLEA